jgi:hypothetical protein
MPKILKAIKKAAPKGTTLVSMNLYDPVLGSYFAPAGSPANGLVGLSHQIPVAVARICARTWACSTPPSGPNIHANKNGYLEIAGVFAKAIGKLG